METHPTPNSFRASREPQRVNGRHDGISHRLRHRAPPNLCALLGIGLRECRKMDRRLVQPLQLKSSIATGPLAAVGRKRLCICRFKIFANALASCLIVDKHEPPGLAQAHRGREAGKAQKTIDASGRQRIGTKLPYIPPPENEVSQLRAKTRVKIGSGAPTLVHAHGQVTA